MSSPRDMSVRNGSPYGKSASKAMKDAGTKETGHRGLESACDDFANSWDYGFGQLSKLRVRGEVTLRRHLRKLLRETGSEGRPSGSHRAPTASGEAEASFTTEVPWPSLWKFAQFAYIAEQYGYRYSGPDPELRDSGPPFFVFRPLPDARERADRTRERFPGALEGGRLPGMRAWPVPVLTLPGARSEVRLLHARIAIDYYGALGRQRIRPWLIGIPAVFLLFLLVNGELHATGLRVAVGLSAALLIALAASRVFMRRRRAAHERLLERSGVRWPP